MSKEETTTKGNRVSEKQLRASDKPQDKVLYVVIRMKKLVAERMAENAVKSKKDKAEVKRIARSYSNAMSGVSVGIRGAKVEDLKSIATNLKTVVSDINGGKYNAKMKEIFEGLAEQYPQPTREAKKFTIENDFLDF